MGGGTTGAEDNAVEKRRVGLSCVTRRRSNVGVLGTCNWSHVMYWN